MIQTKTLQLALTLHYAPKMCGLDSIDTTKVTETLAQASFDKGTAHLIAGSLLAGLRSGVEELKDDKEMTTVLSALISIGRIEIEVSGGPADGFHVTADTPAATMMALPKTTPDSR